jgi:hypothetical protein
LDAGDWERALGECRAWLAEQREEEDVPDDVWGYMMMLGLPFDVIVQDDDESRRQLLAAAGDYGKTARGGSGSLGYDRGEGRVGLSEIAMKPSRNAARRAEAFAEVAAMLADNHPGVRQFRRDYLRSTLLTYDEARAWLDSQGGPYGTGGKLKKLLKLADKLSRTYRWREGDGAYFVLTDHVPPVRPLEVSVSIRHASKIGARPRTLIPGKSPPRYIAAPPAPADYLPNTARITTTADAWVNAKEVMNAFRDAQRQILDGADAAGPTPERTLELVRFVARRIREHGEKDRGACWRAWNRKYPEWSYGSERYFRQTFERFMEGVVYRTYELPNYRLQEKTPFERYRDDWEDGHIGEG